MLSIWIFSVRKYARLLMTLTDITIDLAYLFVMIAVILMRGNYILAGGGEGGGQNVAIYILIIILQLII